MGKPFAEVKREPVAVPRHENPSPKNKKQRGERVLRRADAQLPPLSSLQCTLPAGCTHLHANIKYYIVNIKCKKAVAFLGKGRRPGLRARVSCCNGRTHGGMSREATRSTPRAGGPRDVSPGPASPFPGPNRSWDRAAPAENSRPHCTRVGLVGLHEKWGGNRQSSPPPGYVPHPPTQPTSFSYALPQEFKSLAGDWMGTVLLGWQSRGWGLPNLGVAWGHV